MITAPRGIDDALFKVTGAIASVGTISSEVARGQVYINVSDDTLTHLGAGDVIAMHGDYATRNIAIIKSIVGNRINLDRNASNLISVGSTLYKMNTVKNIDISDLNIDFNGRYGFGVFLRNAQNCTVSNIRSKNIGSKVVQFTAVIDSQIDNVHCEYGFDVADTGGHSYLVRLAVSNDNLVTNCSGTMLRHAVDLSGASRNKVINCRGYKNYSSDYLTHGNNCVDNVFIDCDSIQNDTSAYAFASSNGDKYNKVIGGVVDGAPVIYHDQDGTNTFDGITVIINNKYAITVNGVLCFKNCNFEIVNNALVSYQTTNTVIDFINCTFNVKNSRGLIALNLGTAIVTVNLINCKIENQVSLVAEGNLQTTLNLINSVVETTTDLTTTSALFSNFKTIAAENSRFTFSGINHAVFGLSDTTADVTVDRCTFIKSERLIRRIAGNGSVKYGQNQYINCGTGGDISTYFVYSNLNHSTIGAIDIGRNASPTSGVWAIGSKILLTNLGGDGSVMAVCATAGAPGVWTNVKTI